ncbi:hypothetical protein D3C84_845440 [compost metagenome]
MQVLGHRAGAAWLAQGLLDLIHRPARQQVQMDRRAAVLVDGFADRRRQGVDQAAFEARGGDHAFTEARYIVVQAHGDIFQRGASEFADHQVAPGLYLEPAVARLQWRQGHAALFQRQHPGAVRAQARPAAAAQRQQGRVGA